MQIVALHPHFTLPGGAGRFVLETGARLAARGHRVLVVCIRADPAIVGPFAGALEFREIGGPLSSSLLFWLGFPLVLARVWRALPPPPFVLFPQVFPANWWGFAYKALHRRAPLAWMCHEPSAFIHSRAWLRALPTGVPKLCARLLNPLLKRIDVALARRVDVLFANSLTTKREACRVYGYDPGRVRVCYPGVDAGTFSADPGEPRAQQIITVGRLTAFKNVDVVIRALGILNRGRAEPATLVVVGRGEAQQSLQRLTRELGLESAVRFAGTLEQPALVQALRASRALVLASVDEPFGIVAVEAMACGTPCVVAASGGPAESVLDGETGFHVRRQEPEAYAEKLRTLLEDQERFEALSRGAAARARAFSWDAAADVLEAGLRAI